MKAEHLISLAGVILTALLTGVGLYFGPKRAVRLALEQFRAEKWWERRATAYDDIVRSASRLCGYHTECCGLLRHGDGINCEWRKEALEKNRDALVTLEAFKYSGGFVILAEAEESIRRILRLCDHPYDENEVDFHRRVSGLLLEEVVGLKTCASRDLHIPPKWTKP